MRLLSILNYASKVKQLDNLTKLPKFKDPEKVKKAEIVKKLNKENKLLFGPVIKTNKKKEKQKKNKKNFVQIQNFKENEKDSEFYWLVQSKSIVPISEDSDTVNNNNLDSSKFNSTYDVNNNIESSIENNTKNVNNLQNNEIIPFSAKGLKEIFKFPLIISEEKNFIENNALYTGILPSVSKVLNLTMSEAARNALIEWKLAKIKELGEDGFKFLQQEHFRKGKELHQALEQYLKLKIEPEPETDVFNTWKSISPILYELKPRAELIETFVEHPFLKYKGVVDCVSYIGSNLTAIEWKKSDKLKTNIERTYDAPIQLAAYLGALNSDPKYKYSIKTGYVAVAYTDGKPANLFTLNELEMEKYWRIWLQRLQEYWIRLRDGTLPDPI